jgi:hypothetical protein
VLAGGLATLVVALSSSACATSAKAGQLARSTEPVPSSPSMAGLPAKRAGLHVTSVPRLNSPGRTLSRGSSPKPVPMSASTAVVQGWLSALQALEQASYTSDWRSPDLAATEVDPELSQVVSDLRGLARAGIVTKGSTTLVSVGVISLNGDTAQLVGCVTGDQANFYSSTGRPVPDSSGRAGAQVISAEMGETAVGWKVKSETSKEARCPFA